MPALRLLLVLMIITVLTYTGFVVANEGWNFLAVFIRDLRALSWAGQFNLDFSCFLLLAGLWMAWRHQFAAPGVAMGLLVLVLGAPLFCAYLLICSVRVRGDAAALLLGPQRLRALSSR